MNIEDELKWEQHMVDSGVTKYHQAVMAARYRKVGAGMMPAMEEGVTSYGVSMIREFFEKYEAYIAEFVTVAYNSVGKTNIAAQYISRCDIPTVAFLAAKSIIDTISHSESQTRLAFRISGRLEDQMRMVRFEEDYPKYFEALLDDMELRGVKDYRRKRKVLVHCHDKADVKGKKQEWIPWPPEDRVHIGMNLIELFIQATGLVERVMSRKGNKTTYRIVGTDLALDMIEKNMEIFQYLHPEYLPTLVPPKEWTTPFDGGFWSPALRQRRPMVKICSWNRREHARMLTEANMPLVYEAVNAAQAVPWKINTFVMEQVKAELEAGGIGCPANMNMPAPESPHPFPEQGDMTEEQYRAFLDGIRANRTPDEMAELAAWRDQMRAWHTRNNSNRAKMLGLFNTYKVAKMMAEYERFYYVHSLDSRSRLYPCGTHLSPQGTDLSKGLLQFADGVALSAHGYWHLCIHAAGVYGEDKVSLEDRVAWVHNHAKRIMDTWDDPAGTREFWGSADKPFMFLAACRELAEIWMFYGTKMLTIVSKAELKDVAASYISHLPCAQDGSCNGIQHFSAMLLDPVGAKAVNMTADPEVNDIYGQTAECAADLMRQDMARNQLLMGKDYKTMLPREKSYMQTWLDVLKVDRKVCKRSTMIIPYGGQKSSCRADVNEVLVERLDEFDKSGNSVGWDSNDTFQAGFIMHNYVWAALDTVVVAARRAMKFLGRMATVCNRANQPMIWTTPLGFPCFQDYKSMKMSRVDTKIAGKMVVKYLTPTDDIDKNRMRNAFPPNYVHSMDATHLMMTVTSGLDLGITLFSLVHDSYAVPAGECEAFHKVIRQEFVRLYTPDRLFLLLREQQARHQTLVDKLPSLDLVERGDFNLEEVLDATYFFR